MKLDNLICRNIIHNEIFEDLIIHFSNGKIKNKVFEDLILAWPDNEARLLAAKGIGEQKINILGFKGIIDAFKELDEKYLINDNKLSYEDFEDQCGNIITELLNTKCVNDNIYINEFISNIPKELCTKYNFSLTVKMLRVFLTDKGYIYLDGSLLHNIPYATEKGIKIGLINQALQKEDGNKTNVILMSLKAQDYIRSLLPNIFYEFYAYNPVLMMNINPEYAMDIYQQTHDEISCNLIILDFDATMFDTDFLRVKRRQNFYKINSDDYNSVKYINNFPFIFFDEESPFNLKNNEVLIISNSPASYITNILGDNDYEIVASCGANKSLFINEFINNHSEYNDVFCFGDDEKDALLYETLGYKYYIVSNYSGYPTSWEDVLKTMKQNSKSFFRKEMYYDVREVNYDFNVRLKESKYFDDMIVYFKYFYSTSSNFTLYSNLLNPNRETPDVITYYEFASYPGNKLDWVKSRIDSLINEDFNFIRKMDKDVIKNIVFTKVPGHDEIVPNNDAPCAYLIRKLLEGKAPINNCSDALIRKHSVEKSHGHGTHHDVYYHLDSIKVAKDYINKIKDKTVFLFDDVLTTGASMMACVERLYEAGAAHVVCFAIAKTLPKDAYGLKYLEGGRI